MRFFKYLNLILAGLFGIFIFCVVFYKAKVISFTHDEGYTYQHYVHEPFMDILSLKDGYTNNHILNSIIMKYSEMLFGSSELALRLPNLLAFLLYLIYSYLLLRKKTPVLVIPFFLLLIANTYLLDFFGLARGYGLSIAFMLMSFYHLCKYFDTKKNKALLLFNLAAILAFLSNLTLLYFYIAALISYNILNYLQLKTMGDKTIMFTLKKQNRINFIAIVLSAMVLFEPLRRLLKGNILDFGGREGFIENTIGSLILGLFYNTHHELWHLIILKIVSIVLVLVAFILIVTKILLKDKNFIEKFPHFILANFILLLIVLFTVVQHFLLNSDFIMGRFALFLYPLFVLNVVFLIYYAFSSGFKITTFSFASLISIALLILVFKNLNFKYTIDWRYDSATKNAMEQMIKAHSIDPAKKVTLGINWIFEPVTNFYRETWQLNWLKKTDREGIHKEFDYYYIFNTDSIFDHLKDKPVLFRSEESKSVLISSKP